MTRVRARTVRIASALAVALAATALLAVPTIAAACNGSDPGTKGGSGYVGRYHHHHHWFPASEVGKVASYSAETGKLAITLKNGETVSGLVTEETFINCGSFSHDYRLQLRHHHGDHGDGGHGNWEGPSDEGECGTESLVPGAIVNGAMMHLEEGGAVFDVIFLTPAPTPPNPPTPTPTPGA